MSTKGFLGGLGQGMMQLSATYGQTQLANLEADAQRMKEERLATMQMAQFSLQSQKDVYQMEMGEKKFALLQDEDLRRQEELGLKKQKQQYDQDLPDYKEVTEDIYEPVYDIRGKKHGGSIIGYEKAGENIYFVDEKTGKVYQLKDGKLINADPNIKVGDEEKTTEQDITGRVTDPADYTQDDYINHYIEARQRSDPSYTMSQADKAKLIKNYFEQGGRPFKEGGTIYFKQKEPTQAEIKSAEKEVIKETETKTQTDSFSEVPPVLPDVVNPSATVVPGDVVRDDTTESGIIQQKGWTAKEENAMRDQVNEDVEFLTALQAEVGEDAPNEVWNQRIEDEVLRRLRVEVAGQGLIIPSTDPQHTGVKKDEVKKDEVKKDAASEGFKEGASAAISDITNLVTSDPLALVTPIISDTETPVVKAEETDILKMDYDQAIKVIRDTVKRMKDQKMDKNQIIDTLFKVARASATSKEFKDSKYAKALNAVIIELGSR